ncbi:MAG: DNA-binding domain-containing protein [Pseudomonadota bacterium]
MTEPQFAAALLDPDLPPPAAISAAYRSRFAIYRNNVAMSLIDALATRFPAVRNVVGDEFFSEAARLFVAQHPPASRMIAFYGDTFADFLEALPACAELPYLGDLARLEAARTQAYHAADVTPLGPEMLASLAPDSLGDLRVTLHPAVRIIDSAHPIVTIWAMNAGEQELMEIHDWHSEAALISRPQFDVDVRALPPGGAAFLKALAQGKPLTDAAAGALASAPDFDLPRNLAALFSTGLVASIEGENG